MKRTVRLPSLMNPKRRQSLASSAGGQQLAPVPAAKACQNLPDDFALVRQGRELFSADGGVPGPGKTEQPREECAVEGAQAVAQNGELVLLLLRLFRKRMAVCKDAPPVGMLRFRPEGSQLIIRGRRLRAAEFDLVGDRGAALLKEQAVNTAVLFLQLILFPVCFGDLGSHIKLSDLIEIAKIGEIGIGELLKGVPLLLERFDCFDGLFQLVPAGIELSVNFVKRHRLPSVLYGDAVPGFAISDAGTVLLPSVPRSSHPRIRGRGLTGASYHICPTRTMPTSGAVSLRKPRPTRMGMAQAPGLGYAGATMCRRVSPHASRIRQAPHSVRTGAMDIQRDSFPACPRRGL